MSERQFYEVKRSEYYEARSDKLIQRTGDVSEWHFENYSGTQLKKKKKSKTH